MIYAITYNDDELAGRITLKGKKGKILNEYRILTRMIADRFGSDAIQNAAVLAIDPPDRVNIELDISPDPVGGEDDDKR